jgi:hypothetical protein
MSYVAVGCRVFLAVVFLLAVTGKIAGWRAFREFTQSVVGLRLVPRRAAAEVAATVAAAEGLAVLLAAIPGRDAGIAGGLWAALLALAFTAVVAVSLRRGQRAPCRCFGASATPLGPRHLTRNTVLLAGALLGVASSAASGSPHTAGAIVAAGTGLFAGICVAGFDELADLLLPAR